MIFNVPGHIDMIRNGLHLPIPQLGYPSFPLKTQTRRLNRGIYKIGKDYAVQRKRGVRGESDIRIVIDRIWEEPCYKPSPYSPSGHCFARITEEDALKEGGYTPDEYESVFQELNPKWGGWSRWAFEFHVIEV